jgi:nitrous oxide reductase accessory protein NosL
MIDGYTALFVIGSDVYGPMGKALISFETVNGAKEFMKDHSH